MNARLGLGFGLGVVAIIVVATASCTDDESSSRPDAGADATSSPDVGTTNSDASADVIVPSDSGSPPDAKSDAADAEAGPSPTCLTGGNPLPGVTGTGTCTDPFVIDMYSIAEGTIVSYTTAAGAGTAIDNLSGSASCTTMFGGATARDIIFRVWMPNAVVSLDVSVDAVGAADPRIGVFEDFTCQQPINACANVGGAGQCESLFAKKPDVFKSTTAFVVVSEAVSSGQPLTVRVRANAM
jgi:hypothetical protein